MQLHNKNIEKAILSSIIYNPSFLDELSMQLNNDMYFYDSNHKKIYTTMLDLYQKSEPIDEEFISKYLQSDDKFDDNSIIEILAISPHVDINGYVKELKELTFRRNIVALSTKMFKLAKDEEQDRNLIEDYIQKDLFEMISQESNKGYLTSKEVIAKTLDYLDILKQRGNQVLTGVTTGFNYLNRQTTGFNKGDLIIIAARPAMGKTALALNIILSNLEENNGVIFFSLEMPSEQLMLRLLSVKTSIPLQKLRIGDIDENEWEQISDAMSELEDKTLITDDNTNITINSIKTKARRLKMQYPEIRLIVIDYLQLIQSSQNRDRHLEVSEISRGLKTLARELETPIVALSQLNRELEKRVNKRPMISDLRESGSIEQDADIIMFVHREDVYKHLDEVKKKQKANQMGVAIEENKNINENEVEAELIIGKQRNGPIGTIKLTFIKSLTKFVEAHQEREYNPNIQQTQANIDIQNSPNEIEIPNNML
jgi:replicative DNA helicase